MDNPWVCALSVVASLAVLAPFAATWLRFRK